MEDEKRFFIRDAWKFDPEFKRPEQTGDGLGFDTRALHAGFRPTESLERFRAFVPPIVPSMTFPYESFDKIPYPVYGRTKTPTADILEQRLAALEQRYDAARLRSLEQKAAKAGYKLVPLAPTQAPTLAVSC